MKSTSEDQTLKSRFDTEKQATLASAEQYLNTNQAKPVPFTPSDLGNQRADITKLVSRGNFKEALVALEKLRDAKSGITQTTVTNDQGAPTFIRDARGAKVPPVRETESFEMQYLNSIRAAQDLIDTHPGLKPEVEAKLRAELQLKAEKFFAREGGFHTKIKGGLSQKQLGKEELKKEIQDIGVLLGENGISQAYTKLNVAKDFQNFKDTHSNVVTVTAIQHNGKSHTVIEADVAMKGLTASQKEEYATIGIKSSTIPKPKWFTAMPAWEQELSKKYAPAIAKGDHVMPTQLRQMVGIKNAFEKTTAIYDPESSKLETLATSKHAGTLASLAPDKSDRQRITDENAKQAQELIGPDRKLHCNTLNSGPVGAGDDPEIVKSTKQAMKNVGGAISNTAFNAFRRFGVSNDFSGTKDNLKQMSNSLPDDPAFKDLKNHLQPKGFFGRLFRTGDPQFEIDTLRASGKIDDKTKAILETTIDLRRSVETADKIIKFADSENSSLAVSEKLNKLANKVEKVLKSDEGVGLVKEKLPKHTTLRMCASGKDRTGLAEHNQSAEAIAEKIGATAKDIDAQLLSGGHTAQQAGGIHAGGATIGCYGTKSENRAGIPKSRKEGLETIIEVSASSNKIKGNSKKHDKEIEKEIAADKAAKPSISAKTNTQPQALAQVQSKDETKTMPPKVTTVSFEKTKPISKEMQKEAENIFPPNARVTVVGQKNEKATNTSAPKRFSKDSGISRPK